VPVVVWVGAIVLAVVLSRRQVQEMTAVGILEVQEVPVAPVLDGRIQGIPVDLFEEVEAGQAVAVMDDSTLRKEFGVAEAELARLRSEVESRREEVQLEQHTLAVDRLNALRRFTLDLEEARLDSLDRVVKQEANRVELERLGVELDRQRQLVANGTIDQRTFDDTRLRYEELEVTIQKNEAAIREARGRVTEAEERLKTRADQTISFSPDPLISPLSEGVRVQQAQIDLLSEQRRSLVLRSPLAGKVSQVFAAAGETVVSGTPLLMIARADSVRVVGYVDQSLVKEVRVGETVEIVSRHLPRESVKATILRVGPAMQEVPESLRRHPNFAQWGLPILVGDVPQGMFHPGETLDLRLANAR